MYFNEMIQELGEIPIYLKEQLLEISNILKNEFSPISGLFYGGVCITPSKITDLKIQSEFYRITNRVAFYTLTLSNVFKEMVPIERSIFAINKESSIPYFSRYVDRVGEKVICPLFGSSELTISNKTEKLTNGILYRINSRANGTFNTNNLSVILVINFLDIDLDEHLTQADRYAIFPLAKEES